MRCSQALLEAPLELRVAIILVCTLPVLSTFLCIEGNKFQSVMSGSLLIKYSTLQ